MLTVAAGQDADSAASGNFAVTVLHRQETAMSFRFQREHRTPYSEAYAILIDDNEEPSGRVDIHFTDSVVHATLCIDELTTEEDLQELIGEIDERLVMTADPYREDFVVSVWRGRDGGAYSDEESLDEESDEDENGFRL